MTEGLTKLGAFTSPRNANYILLAWFSMVWFTIVNMLPSPFSRPIVASMSSNFPVFMSLVGLFPVNNVFLRGLSTNNPHMMKSRENTKTKNDKTSTNAGKLALTHRFALDANQSSFIRESLPWLPRGMAMNGYEPPPSAPPRHWGMTVKNSPCKICIRKRDFCAKHEHQRGRK
jgi:hypothetical protein